MKYRHLNEISKYFKPVDYIEELSPEEDTEKMIQDEYISNLRTMKEVAENFNVETDSIVFTFYETLYTTGGRKFKLVVNNANRNFNDVLNCDNITSTNIYSLILSAVIQFMYRMSTISGLTWEYLQRLKFNRMKFRKMRRTIHLTLFIYRM